MSARFLKDPRDSENRDIPCTFDEKLPSKIIFILGSLGPFFFSVLETVSAVCLREHLVGIKIAPDRAIRLDRDA